MARATEASPERVSLPSPGYRQFEVPPFGCGGIVGSLKMSLDPLRSRMISLAAHRRWIRTSRRAPA